MKGENRLLEALGYKRVQNLLEVRESRAPSLRVSGGRSWARGSDVALTAILLLRAVATIRPLSSGRSSPLQAHKTQFAGNPTLMDGSKIEHKPRRSVTSRSCGFTTPDQGCPAAGVGPLQVALHAVPPEGLHFRSTAVQVYFRSFLQAACRGLYAGCTAVA